jgi:molybdate transport system permease protein
VRLELSPFLVSLRLGVWVTAILLFAGFPLAWAFSRARGKWALWIESLTSLPLVLAPTVLGFYLLIVLSPKGPVGSFFLSAFGARIAFSFAGIAAGGCISGLPFMLTALKTGILGVPQSLLEASYTLGKGRLETIVRIVLPNMKTALLAGVITTFAHAIGEFGIVLMIGGSIPGMTKTVSIAVYERVEALDFSGAHAYAAALVAASYAAILALNALQRREARR